MDVDLKRLIVRHRHVAPMVSALLAGSDARVKISDAAGNVILHREAGPDGDGQTNTYPILVEGQPIGWVEGTKIAVAVAAVLSYASAREADKRSLAQEALDRYRELNLIYDLAETIGATLEVNAVASVAAMEAGRLPGGGTGFLLLRGDDGTLSPAPEGAASPVGKVLAGSGIVGSVFIDGEAEIVNDVAADPRATAAERGVSSMVVAPLKVRGERIGVVGTASATPVEYRAGDLKIIGAIAALAAPTLDQAATHEAVLRTAEPA